VRHFGVCAKVGVLLAAVAVLCAFGLNYNASKSNTGNLVLTYSSSRVSAAQASAVLAELEKAGKTPDETTVRRILQKNGVQAEGIRKIVISGIVHSGGGKGYGILLLEKPEDEAGARAAIQRVK